MQAHNLKKPVLCFVVVVQHWNEYVIKKYVLKFIDDFEFGINSHNTIMIHGFTGKVAEVETNLKTSVILLYPKLMMYAFCIYFGDLALLDIFVLLIDSQHLTCVFGIHKCCRDLLFIWPLIKL